LSGTNTTDTKAVELKSLQASIANQLERRREELALLQAEAKKLNDRMQSLASSFFFSIGGVVVVLASPPRLTRASFPS
jgi:DNA anti-recombination protein RmuC